MKKNSYKTRIVRFVICGGLSALVELGVFAVVERIVPVYLAALISFCCGLITSFLLNKLVVFRSDIKKREVANEVGKFLVLGLLNSQVSSWMTTGLTLLTSSSMLSKVVTMIVIAAWNYLIMNKFIFRQPKRSHDDSMVK